MRAGDWLLSTCAAAMIVSWAYTLNRVTQRANAVQTDLTECVAGWKTCAAQLGKERAVCEKAERALGAAGAAEYFIWEVHDVNIQHNVYDPKDDGQLEALCIKLGDHSVLSLDAELNSYSLWGDGAGHQKLGCRYVKRKTP